MHSSTPGFNFDPRFEDPTELAALNRRGFLGRVLGGALAGSALLSLSAKSAFAAEDMNDMGMAAAPDDERFWELVTKQFLIRKDLAYMNTGTRGPSPRSVHMAQIEALNRINTDYVGFRRDHYTMEYSADFMAKFANFVGCKPNELALANNTTDGMITGTFGPVLEPGDEILYTNHDHGGGTNPVLNRAKRDKLTVGVIDISDPKLHPPDSPDDLLKQFEAAITPRTKLLSFCHANYTDGLFMPVKEICEMARSKGVITLVDGAQPPGMVKLDMHDLGCDMYAGPSHKWMMASMQSGFFYVREDMQERIEPVISSTPYGGKNMYGEDLSTNERWVRRMGSASKYTSRGSSSYPKWVSVNAALDFHHQLPREGIEARLRYLAGKLRMGLHNINGVEVFASEDPRLHAGLVPFRITGVPTRDLNTKLWDDYNIYIRNVTHREVDWDSNRASMHIMVTAAAVDKLLGAVGEIAKSVNG